MSNGDSGRIPLLIGATAIGGFLCLCVGIALWVFHSASVDLVEDLGQLRQATLYKLHPDGRGYCLPITSEVNVSKIEQDLRSFKGRLPSRVSPKGYLLCALDVNGKNKNVYLPPSQYSESQLETLKVVIRRADRGIFNKWLPLDKNESAEMFRQYFSQQR